MTLELTRTIGCLPFTVRGQPIVLGAHPKGETFLYCHDKNVIIRSIDDPKTSDVYAGHASQALVAKYSPSGFYIASADKTGKLHIWDTINPEHILKNEYEIFSGPIKDLQWDSESKRIAIAGEGRTSYTTAISADTGTSLGEMKGHSKAANSIAYKSTRPFRVASGGEDYNVAFYQGPPFKCDKTSTVHKNFVNVVRYAPSGEFFVSGGADGKVFAFDGKTGENIGEIGDPAHKGGIYGLSFSPDSQRLVTASADKTVKIWAVGNTSELPKEPSTMFAMGAALTDMQVSCVWARSDTIISVSLSGCIHFFTPDALTDGPRLTIRGHNKPISAYALCPEGNAAGAHLVTASSDGQMVSWNLETGEASYVSGEGHQSQVQALTVNQGGQIASVGLDDTLRFTSLSDLKYGSAPARKLDTQPRAVASFEDLVAIACIKNVLLLNKGSDLTSIPTSYDVNCLTFNHDGSILVIGGDDNKIHVHRVPAGGGDSAEIATVDTAGPVLSLSFSSDGERLAATDGARKVFLIKVAEWKTVADIAHHSARVTCCSWSPDGKYLATGSLDTSIIVMPTDGSRTKHTYIGAHPKSQVNGIAWLDNSRLVSVGQDSMIKLWKFTS